MSKIWELSRKPQLTEKEVAESIPYPEGSPTPSEMTRADCCWPGSPRPCPLVSCKYNNYLSPTDNGTILLTWPHRKPEDVPPGDSCALDVAARGHTPSDPLSFGDMAPLTGTTRQNVQLMIKAAQKKGRREIDDDEE